MRHLPPRGARVDFRYDNKVFTGTVVALDRYDDENVLLGFMPAPKLSHFAWDRSAVNHGSQHYDEIHRSPCKYFFWVSHREIEPAAPALTD